MASVKKATKKAPDPAKLSTDRRTNTAIIRQITIEQFRGIKSLKWNPAPGLNVILGGGDVGKTTILDAIALLLNPSNAAVVSESDYYFRESDPGFCIQAVMSLPSTTEIGQQQKFCWPWEWNGKDAVAPIPDHGADIPSPDIPVYRLQVRGTCDMELIWEIVQPNDETDVLSSAVRRAIGVVRLVSDDRNDRDLRLVYGSALDRLLADVGLKARIGKQISTFDLNRELSPEAKMSLKQLDEVLREELLPSGLELGLTSAQGISIGALVGLLARKKHPESDEAKAMALPLSSWGAGTRRMATLQIAAATQNKTRIAVIDEVERGLEPYRVRRLIDALQSEQAQTFITTHSAVAINAATKGNLWYLDLKGSIGELPQAKIEKQQQRDPETFLARLAVIAEGPTEVGFISHFLDKAIRGNPLDHGIRVCNGQGTPTVLDLLEAMNSGGLTFGGFVDATTESPNRWRILKDKMGDLLFQWNSGCTEQSVISFVDASKLTELIKDEDGNVDPERRKILADRLRIDDKSMDAIVAKARNDLRALIIAAASGSPEGALDNATAKTWKKHGRQWFKSEEGGRELARKAEALGVWPQLKPLLMPFLNEVRAFLGQPKSDDL